jgi:hypothetical protein
MIAESIYKNYGKAVKQKHIASFTCLSSDAIDMISGWTVDQIKEVYVDFGIRYLKSEVRAWDKLGKYHISNVIREMIQAKG